MQYLKWRVQYLKWPYMATLCTRTEAHGDPVHVHFEA